MAAEPVLGGGDPPARPRRGGGRAMARGRPPAGGTTP